MTHFHGALSSIEDLKLKDPKILGCLAKKIVKELMTCTLTKNELKEQLLENISIILGQYTDKVDDEQQN